MGLQNPMFRTPVQFFPYILSTQNMVRVTEGKITVSKITVNV